MKKLLAIFLSALMLCTMIPFATVFAAEEGINIVVEVSEEEINAGDEFEVTVILEGNPGIIGAMVEIEFDSDNIELLGEWDGGQYWPEISHPRKYKTNFITYGPDDKTCLVLYVNGTGSNVTEEEFFTAVFKAKDGAYTGNYDLTVKYNPKNFFGEGMVDVAILGTENGSITINGVAPTCKHEYSADCDATCNLCDEVRETTIAHEYYYDCDPYCTVCCEKTNAKAKHNLTHVEAKEATCAEPGNIEYWRCEYCNICWDNEYGAGYQLTMRSIVLYVDHVLPEGLPLCADAVCSTCNQLIEGWAHEPVDGMYCQAGECLYCGEIVDAVSGHESNAWPACGAGNCIYCGIEMAAKCVSSAEYACQDGTCIYCEKEMPGTGHEYFSDCEGICLICNEETREADHNIVHKEAVAPTCTTLGNIEYWFCDVCGMAWLDKDCTLNTNQFAIRLPMADHSYNFPCDQWCTECCEMTNASAAHKLVYTAAVAPTCTENGNIEYWTCEYCESSWDNAEATGMTLNKMMTVVWAEGHVYDDDADLDCNTCGYIREVLSPIAVLGNLGTSVCEDVNGLAFGFSVNVSSIMVEGNEFLGGAVIPFDNGEIYNLSGIGAIVTNQSGIELTMDSVNDDTVKNVPAVLLYDVDYEDDGAIEFAVRIVNIPNFTKDIAISARPYFIYSTIEGEEIVVYGDVIASSYNAALN